jgi:hypothetical protein
MADPTADEIKAAELKARMKFLFGVEKTFDPLWESRRNSSNDLEKHVFIMKRVQGNSNTEYHCIYCTWKRTGAVSSSISSFTVSEGCRSKFLLQACAPSMQIFPTNDRR